MLGAALFLGGVLSLSVGLGLALSLSLSQTCVHQVKHRHARTSMPTEGIRVFCVWQRELGSAVFGGNFRLDQIGGGVVCGLQRLPEARSPRQPLA